MDAQFDRINADLDKKKESHPNLTKLWREYINIKKLRFTLELARCDNMLNYIDRMPDQTPEQIVITAQILKMVLPNNT